MQSSIASDQKLDGPGIRLINRVCASLVIATSVYPPHASKKCIYPIFTLQKHSMKQTQVSLSLVPRLSLCALFRIASDGKLGRAWEQG